MIRQPIIVVMGHVDHGKTSLLDKIRNTAIANKEAGGITQHIGASEVPIDVIKKICKSILSTFKINITIPGLLFIDTPGHEAFTNLRKRGGSVADLAILVVDITKNFEPQTYEAIEILRQYKTPFIVAANKIDLITGWRPNNNESFAETITKQQPNVVSELDNRIYEIIGKLSELGFNSERFDRVKDFQREVVIIPVSAKTGEGIPELLLYATGLAQRFLEKRISIEVNGPGKGSIIEKKEEKGLGTTIDVILYDGTLKVNDTIAFATSTGIGLSKIKALLKPKPLQELRESSSKFYYVDSVSAASGVKISGTGLEDALPGSLVLSTDYPNYENEIKAEIADLFATERKGIILKADSIGTIEAISKLLAGIGVSISKKGLGNVTKRDVLDAYAMRAIDPYSAVILSFGVKIDEDALREAEATDITIINENVIYKIIDEYKEWLENEKKKARENAERSLIFPGMIKVIPNTCFRVSHPAIFGVEVLAGKIRPSYLLMNKNGNIVGKIREIQDNGVTLQEAKKGDKVAISMDEVTFGRQVKEEDILYTHVNDESERLLRQKFSDLLNNEEKELLNVISEIKQKRQQSM
ncbi:MAG: translation initiation factor IF-2 [Candidatus Micrarchaeota archaeon]